jgi:UrcA family protein
MTMNTISPRSAVRRIVATLLMGTLASGLAAVASAAQEGDVLQEVVKFGDLNVSNAQGAATLYARIHRAAANVCRSFDNRDFESRRQIDACMHKAITEAVNKVDQPSLYAVYNAKNGTSKPVILASRTR